MTTYRVLVNEKVVAQFEADTLGEAKKKFAESAAGRGLAVLERQEGTGWVKVASVQTSTQGLNG